MDEQLQSEYDFLNFSKDHYIKTNVTRDEQIEFSDKILKINKFGFKQERNIIITDNIDTANNISKIINHKYKIVTLDGQVINIGGSITGGSINNNYNINKSI